MANVGFVVERCNSTTSLAKYFHELPDLDHNSTDFCNGFWGLGDLGVDVLFTRMQGAERTMEELLAFWKERIKIEAEYAKKLGKLAKFPLGTEEIGGYRTALDRLKAETEAQSAQHVECLLTMKRELEKKTSEFVEKQVTHKDTSQASVEVLRKAKRMLEKRAKETRETYEAACTLESSRMADPSQVEGEAPAEVQITDPKQQETIEAKAATYQHAEKIARDIRRQWNEAWKTYCDKCEDLEEDRLDFIKDSVWAYANAISAVCVSDDVSCESIRVCLEQVHVYDEVENFVRDYGTGAMLAEPMPTVEIDQQRFMLDEPTTEMAYFTRVSRRGVHAQFAPPVVPQQTPSPVLGVSPIHSVVVDPATPALQVTDATQDTGGTSATSPDDEAAALNLDDPIADALQVLQAGASPIALANADADTSSTVSVPEQPDSESQTVIMNPDPEPSSRNDPPQAAATPRISGASVERSLALDETGLATSSTQDGLGSG
ncbi:hypothetical protein FRB90_001914 [Tulasnella sp. 427]|nr:hypothetical protein FRB90_001914 [Tulasnella sp. 427]